MIDVIVNWLGAAMALALIALIFPRLVVMHPTTTKPIYFLMYLPKFSWAVWILIRAYGGQIELPQLLGLLGMLTWAFLSRKAWCGPVLPQFARSDVAPLGPAADIPIDIPVRSIPVIDISVERRRKLSWSQRIFLWRHLRQDRRGRSTHDSTL